MKAPTWVTTGRLRAGRVPALALTAALCGCSLGPASQATIAPSPAGLAQGPASRPETLNAARPAALASAVARPVSVRPTLVPPPWRARAPSPPVERVAGKGVMKGTEAGAGKVPDRAAAAGTAAPAGKSGAMPADVRDHLRWVLASGDHEGRVFAVIDKRRARLWLFDRAGALLGHTPVLLGYARGDHSVPGIGERPIEDIRPWERTTPAGRFIIRPGRNAQGEDIFWVDYDAAVSLHRVRPTNPRERRLERLATSTPADNRISYGCINVPAAFYNREIKPRLAGGVVYLLPETTAGRALFSPATATPPGPPARNAVRRADAPA